METISFSEKAKGWTSFWDMFPEFYARLNNTFYAFKDGELYEHHTEGFNELFGKNVISSVETIFNQEMDKDKIFRTVVLESLDEWDIEVSTNLNRNSTITKEELNHRESRWFGYIRKNEEESSSVDVIQGIGNIIEVNGNEISFNNISPTINVGDVLFQTNNNISEKIGTIDLITDNVVTVNTIDNTPIVSNFAYSEKDRRIEGAEIRGRYMIVKLTDDSNEQNELFAVTSKVSRSYL